MASYGGDHAAGAYQAIRALNHEVVGAIPAPVAYELLGSLQAAVQALPQALEQIRYGLSASLTCYELVEDSGADPAETIGDAADHLTAAASQLQAAGQRLDTAQQCLAGISYRKRHDDTADRTGETTDDPNPHRPHPRPRRLGL